MVNRLVNLQVGRTHTLSMEVDLAALQGTVDKYGVVQLRLAPGTRPQCDLGGTEYARQRLGEFLLEQLNIRYSSRQPVLPLGWIETERGHTLPTSFILRSHAKPGSTTGESALVALITLPGGQSGIIPDGQTFPYLIPDEITAGGATLLVSASYPKLLAGEAQALFGQLLFPNTPAFTTVSEHTDTQDQVVFGRLAASSDAPKALRSRANAVGVAAQLVTREVGGTPRPVTIIVSSEANPYWEWALQVPNLGTLEPRGASALYTPPSSLDALGAIGVQRVIAYNSVSGERHEAVVVLQRGPNVIKMTPSLSANFRPGGSDYITAELDWEGVPGLIETWSVVGEGTCNGGMYQAPASPSTDFDIVVYEVGIPIDGVTYPLGFGYSIIRFDLSLPRAHWQSLTMKLRSVNTNAAPYANGLQQFGIDVTLDTGADGQPVLDEELATLRLVYSNGQEVPFLHAAVEGLPNPSAGQVVPDWAFASHRNRYQLAASASSADPADVPPVAPAAATPQTRTFYVHTRSEREQDFVVRLTDIYNQEHTSNSDGGGESSEQVLRIRPRGLPDWTQADLSERHRRVIGGFKPGDGSDGGAATPENPDFAWNFQTVDYWHYTLGVNGTAIRILRIEWEEDGPGVRWGSQQPNEDGFSYLGYRLIPKGGVEPNALLHYATELYNPVLYNSPSFTGQPYNAQIVRAEQGNEGTLLIALHRELNIYYRQKTLIPGFDLERITTLALWDEYGRFYRCIVGFAGNDRIGPTINIISR